MNTQKDGATLKAARKAKGLTQEQAGTALGSNKSLISNYENNRRSPGLDFLKKLGKVYGVRFVVEDGLLTFESQ